MVPWPFIIFGWIGLGLIGWQVAQAIGTGQVRMRGGSLLRREDNPRSFWLGVAVHIPMLAICTWLALSAFRRIFAN
jgi:hypothetical protein